MRVVESLRTYFFLGGGVRRQPGRKAALITEFRNVFTFTTFNTMPMNKKCVRQWLGKEIWTKGKLGTERLLASPQVLGPALQLTQPRKG